MVLTAKIFQVKENSNLGLMVWKFKDFRQEEIYKTMNGDDIKLTTEILDIKLTEDSISGIFSKDFINRRYYRRNLVENAITEEVPFWIKRHKDQCFLIAIAPTVARGVKKLLANSLANKLSEILFIKSDVIVEVRLSHEILKELHESNPQATKLIWFDEVDIPGIDKLCLAGSDLADSQLYRNYLKHGKIWYVVFEVQKRAFVVGITRNFVVTLFSKSTIVEFVHFLESELFKLVK